MGNLTRAIEAVEDRKVAVLGNVESAGISFTTEAQTRAIFVGYDIDYEEFRELAHRAAAFFARATFHVPVPQVCEAAWGDGILIGLMLGSMQDRDA